MKFKYSLIIILTLILIIHPKHLNAQQLLWDKTFDNGDNNCARCLATDNSGNIYVSGSSTDVGSHCLTIKYNEFGDTLWSRCSDIDVLGIASDSDENIVIGGTTFHDDSIRVRIIKYNSEGHIIWTQLTKQYTVYLGSGKRCLAIDSKDNIIFCTVQLRDIGGKYDYAYLTLKYNSEGEFQWANIHNSYWYDIPKILTIDNEDNIIITGQSQQIPSNKDWFTIKYNEFGERLWARRIDVGYTEWPWGIATDKNRNIFIAGIVDESIEYLTQRIYKYDESGELIWSKEFKDTLDFIAGSIKDIEIDNCNNILIAGSHADIDSLGYHWSRFYLAKLDQNAEYIWTYTSPRDSNITNYVSDMTLDHLGKIIATGYSAIRDSNIYIENYRTIKVEDMVTNIDNIQNSQTFTLSQNYPNPLNPTTTISYDLPEAQNIKLQVFDITGRLVETLFDGYKEAGHWEQTWNASMQSSGIYIYRLTYGDQSVSRKMVVLK